MWLLINDRGHLYFAATPMITCIISISRCAYFIKQMHF